ncbi:MAG: DUF1207 domain-containing protein [Ignavibacteriales bacterium]|nr:DUF1207 domain-containing protein [Ignavibacteriales bacterium]
MMRFKYFSSLIFFIFLNIISPRAYSQAVDENFQPESLSNFNLFPGGLQFPPLKTNTEETRVGLVRFLDRAQMKVELGNSIDLIEYKTALNKLVFRVGIDFFAYAYVKDSEGLYLQIDAIDGFFGGNITVACTDSFSKPMARLRILHHSAHLADGNYWIHTYPREWSKEGGPIPFSRDFGELVLLHHLNYGTEQLRYYGGISYATLNRPAEFKRLAGLAGIEFTTSRLNLKILNQNLSPFISYTMTMTGTPKYSPSHHAEAGIKIGSAYGKGFNLFFSYYKGRHLFGEYYDQRLETIGAGFNVDF